MVPQPLLRSLERTFQFCDAPTAAPAIMEFNLVFLLTVLTLNCASKQIWFHFAFEVRTNENQCVFSIVCLLLLRLTHVIAGHVTQWQRTCLAHTKPQV